MFPGTGEELTLFSIKMTGFGMKFLVFTLSGKVSCQKATASSIYFFQL